MFIRALTVVAAGYLLGNLNGAVLLSRLLAHDDVRRHGSGNAGFTNFCRNYGGLTGLLVFLIDAAKASLAVWLGQYLFAPLGLGLEGAALASVAVGLGHDFLRHVERTRLLLHVLDISGSEGRDPVEDYEQINRELTAYGELSQRPQIVVCNKKDLPEAAENLERLKAHLAGKDIAIFSVSAATHQGFEELQDATVKLLDTLPPLHPFAEEEVPLPTPAIESFAVVKDDDGVYEVDGPAMQRLIDSVNFEDEESMNWFHRTLRRWGVIDALRQAGAGEGDTVRIGDMEFDFVE